MRIKKTDIKKVIWKTKGLWILTIFSLIFLSNIENITGIIIKDPYEEWNEIKKSEEKITLTGTLNKVERIEDTYNTFFTYDIDRYTLVEIDHCFYDFKQSMYKELKPYEGKNVEIVCFITSYDGYYSIYSANHDDGYIKEI